MNHSKYCLSLATTFSYLSGRARIPLRYKCSYFEAIHDFFFFGCCNESICYHPLRCDEETPFLASEVVVYRRKNDGQRSLASKHKGPKFLVFNHSQRMQSLGIGLAGNS